MHQASCLVNIGRSKTDEVEHLEDDLIQSPLNDDLAQSTRKEDISQSSGAINGAAAQSPTEEVVATKPKKLWKRIKGKISRDFVDLFVFFSYNHYCLFSTRLKGNCLKHSWYRSVTTDLGN